MFIKEPETAELKEAEGLSQKQELRYFPAFIYKLLSPWQYLRRGFGTGVWALGLSTICRPFRTNLLKNGKRLKPLRKKVPKNKT